MTAGRYRWRTGLRRRLPWVLAERRVLAKGRKDCGAHEFYRADDRTERCYHCQAGSRPYRPEHFAPTD